MEGRGTLYKTSFHFLVISFTVLLLVTGITTRFGITEAKQALCQGLSGCAGIVHLLDQLAACFGQGRLSLKDLAALENDS